MRRPPHGNLPAVVLLLVAVYCNLAAEAMGPPRGGADGDEFTNVVRKVGTLLIMGTRGQENPQRMNSFTFQPQPKRYHMPIWWVWTPSTLRAHLHGRRGSEGLARREPRIGSMFWGWNPAMMTYDRKKPTKANDMERRRRYRVQPPSSSSLIHLEIWTKISYGSSSR